MIENKYRQYVEKLQKVADVKFAAAVLNWDEETYLPEKGATFRGKQMATLSTLAHDLFTEKEVGEILQELSQAPTLDKLQKGNVQRTIESYEKSKKYTTEFVHRQSMTASECYHTWMKARKENDFEQYQPALQKMVDLKKEEAELLGYQDHPYDALLDDFEKGATVNMLDQVFSQVVAELKPVTDRILAQKPLDNSLLHQHFDKDQQWNFSLTILKAIGFDFEAGRQDISEHPFTTSFSPQDVRVTTRVDEEDFAFLLWSSIHEGGHALYEQGLSTEQYGLPAGEAASLSIHESQSRLWENNVGRGLPFWKNFYPVLKETFKKQLGDKDLSDFYRAMNKVEASPIRTEADELTYHFHVLIRYEIEKELIAGKLAVKDLREAWNSAYKKYLGIDIPDDKTGVLQDIHWSFGGFGYFPTYSLGSFYAAQFYQTAEKEIPDLTRQIASGNFSILLQWLRENIHQHGSLFRSEELCTRVTGEPLNLQFFMKYVREKYGEFYKL